MPVYMGREVTFLNYVDGNIVRVEDRASQQVEHVKLEDLGFTQKEYDDTFGAQKVGVSIIKDSELAKIQKSRAEANEATETKYPAKKKSK